MWRADACRDRNVKAVVVGALLELGLGHVQQLHRVVAELVVLSVGVLFLVVVIVAVAEWRSAIANRCTDGEMRRDGHVATVANAAGTAAAATSTTNALVNLALGGENARVYIECGYVALEVQVALEVIKQRVFAVRRRIRRVHQIEHIC